jgi:hypothetical protein
MAIKRFNFVKNPIKPISTQPMYTSSECNFGKLFKQRRIIYKREAENGQKHFRSLCAVMVILVWCLSHWRKQGKIQQNKMEVPFVSKSERTNK